MGDALASAKSNRHATPSTATASPTTESLVILQRFEDSLRTYRWHLDSWEPFAAELGSVCVCESVTSNADVATLTTAYRPACYALHILSLIHI